MCVSLFSTSRPYDDNFFPRFPSGPKLVKKREDKKKLLNTVTSERQVKLKIVLNLMTTCRIPTTEIRTVSFAL